jgi:hypothetical protein
MAFHFEKSQFGASAAGIAFKLILPGRNGLFGQHRTKRVIIPACAAHCFRWTYAAL